jgi:oxygen-independent coproporphyrinogen-3 oxidase
MALLLGTPQEVDTIFVGGGTPTRLGPRGLACLTAAIRHWLPLAPGGEWTVEANPGTIDPEKADVLADAGVNRVSLGAQTFHADLLRVLERNHAPGQVAQAVELVRPRFPRWSLDLIFGVPGSTPERWAEDLEAALGLDPEHLSCYGLTYEKGTALWKQRQAGTVRAVAEDVERAMLEHTIDRLAAAGLPSYEVSNHSRPGQECRHNLVYWANDAYFGIGLGAARYVRGVRSVNTRDLAAYLKRIEAGAPATGPTETLDPEARARETAVLMLRRTAVGLQRHDFTRRTGFDIDTLAAPALARGVARGWLDDDGSRVRLTREGLFVADSVMCEFL